MTDTNHLKTIEKRLLWLSRWMIHHANHVRPRVDGIKTGGHQASSASVVSIMTALYFSALRPEDRVAVKPDASPVFHAIQYLMGRQTREKLENFRGYGGAQSYPSRTKDVDEVDFSTGSVGLGVGITALASIVQDFVRAKQWGEGKLGRMVALVGDAELDEGNVYEVLQEGWKNDLRNCWWIVDYNRQSLDGILIVGTPSGVTLAPEGGAHQSIGTPLIGISQDGLAAFEPAFADELAVIMEWAFDYMQRDGENAPDERTWLRDETGGSVYLRLTTKPLEQPLKRVDDDFRQGAIDGAYWLRKPGPNCAVAIAYQGAVADEAIAAAGVIGEFRRDVGVLAVTSADRLNAGWTAAQRERARGNPRARSHVERLLEPLPGHCAIITVIDGHPATLSWLGAVAGHRTIPHGVEHFGQTGTIGDLYRHFRIDRNAIAASVIALTAGRRAREHETLLFP
ncbi:hypothetical protein I6F15_26975 [Bradyrhizobium sp. BRP14]|nr:hypothetical protein [Bradyrhizobium sp. BRP14]